MNWNPDVYIYDQLDSNTVFNFHLKYQTEKLQWKFQRISWQWLIDLGSH